MEIKEVFEPVLNFIRSLQKKEKEPASKQAAKDRLKLVLMQDRASVSPDFFEMMKKEIIDVIKKYIEIDEEALEVELTRGLEAGLEGPALYANIPIKNVKPVAPKASEDGEVDDKNVEIAETEDVKPLSEEEASKVADDILNNIENVATVEGPTDDVVVDEQRDESKDAISEISENVNEESSKTDDGEKSKATKSRTTKKSTGTKKKEAKTVAKKKTDK